MEKLVVQKWSSRINEVIIGKEPSLVKVGGEEGLPFLFKEGRIPNKPRIAFEIQDIRFGWAGSTGSDECRYLRILGEFQLFDRIYSTGRKKIFFLFNIIPVQTAEGMICCEEVNGFFCMAPKGFLNRWVKLF